MLGRRRGSNPDAILNGPLTGHSPRHICRSARPAPLSRSSRYRQGLKLAGSADAKVATSVASGERTTIESAEGLTSCARAHGVHSISAAVTTRALIRADVTRNS